MVASSYRTEKSMGAASGVDPLLPDDDAGLRSGRLVDDRHDRDGLWR
jgi:hypothetical protein